MYKKSLSILFIFSLLFIACDKSDDPEIDQSASVDGQWNVTRVKTTYQTKGTTAQVSELDLSKDEVFFNFKTDGTYTTNAKINLTSITKSGKTFEGTYKIVDNKIELDYLLEDFNIRAKFNFKINELQSKKMAISLDESSLVDAFNASIGQLSATNQIVAKLLVDNIADFEALINLEK